VTIDEAGPIEGDGLVLVPVAADRVDAVLAGELGPYTAGPGWPRDDTAAALSFRAVRGMTWLIAVDGIVVGELGTKGPPDAAGWVEIGYGLAAPSRRLGIGTRAVTALVEWLLARDDVLAVTAHVDPVNTPSVRLLDRLGFRRVGAAGDEDVYRLALDDPGGG
jgi:RimJ/RimL family protein N-acetyltransferase